jgi:hypothetical protein
MVVVGWTIRAVIETQLAIIAPVFRPGKGVVPETAHVTVDVRTVQEPEQRIEGRAQVETAPATVTDVGHPKPFLVQRIRQIVIRHKLLPKKPACDGGAPAVSLRPLVLVGDFCPS